MVNLRIVAPPETTPAVIDLFDGNPSVVNVVVLPGAARKPPGDVVLADVAREDASVVLADLRRLGLHHSGSIAVETVDLALSDVARAAISAAEGSPADAVVWEELAARTSESSELSASFLVFMVVATLIAAIGILLDSAILIVGAMVVGPEFGPVAGFCVAAVQGQRRLAIRSLTALVAGFSLAIAVTIGVGAVTTALGWTPAEFGEADHGLSRTIASPDWYAVAIGLLAGVAGLLSLSTAKSGALVGVLISVTTIPAAANIAIAVVYGDDKALSGSVQTLLLNLGAILAGGLATLWVQRVAYAARRRRHAR